MSNQDVIKEKNYSREEYVYLAKLYEKSEFFDDMVFFIKKFIELNPILSIEERNIFSAGYKNVVSSKRESWKMLNSKENKEAKKNSDKVAYLKKVKSDIEKEIDDICNEIQDVIDKYLIPKASGAEDKVFYMKLKGDYYRYKCEYTTGNEKDKFVKLAESLYKQATDIAKNNIPINNSLRFGLALNFSVFYFEIKNSKDKAIEIAKGAFEDAMKIRDEKNKSKETLLIIQLLKENLSLWDSEIKEDE